MKPMNVKELVERMTLEEKIEMCSGVDFWHLKGIERLGIPSIMVSDGPHGLRKQADKADNLGINDSIQAVCFPTAAGTASSFNRALLAQPWRNARGGMPGGACGDSAGPGCEYQALASLRPQF